MTSSTVIAIILAFPVVVPTFGPSGFPGHSSLPVVPTFPSFQLFTYSSGQCCGSGSIGSGCFRQASRICNLSIIIGTDPDPSIIERKKSEENLDYYGYCFVTYITED
jgi:hypothetical protein